AEGETDPMFVNHFIEILSARWRVYDNDGYNHVMHFNGNVAAPILFKGWDTLRDFFRLTKDVAVKITFYGNFIFSMDILDGMYGCSCNEHYFGCYALGNAYQLLVNKFCCLPLN
ncbi:hypothetical protein RYX36_009143, partial [Vicia faba]